MASHASTIIRQIDFSIGLDFFVKSNGERISNDRAADRMLDVSIDDSPFTKRLTETELLHYIDVARQQALAWREQEQYDVVAFACIRTHHGQPEYAEMCLRPMSVGEYKRFIGTLEIGEEFFCVFSPAAYKALSLQFPRISADGSMPFAK